MRRTLGFFATGTVLGLLMLLAGCAGDTGPAGPAGQDGAPGDPALVTNATCLAADCHGKTSLTKTIVNTLGNPETVPLYVNETQFAATVHGDQLCVGCHNDINASGGAHGPVAKTYGGWARFSKSQPVEAFATNEIVRTRNYYTAASRSCVTCHSDHAGFANSAHATIFKMRNSEVDAVLSAAVGKTVGEDYEVGNCNRCHAACSTCHFKSTITRKASGSPYDFWDQNQASYPAAGFSDAMSEFQMDWTTNVASHEFRPRSYFENDSEGVCEACHTGFYKPAAVAYYWTDAGHTTFDNVTATNVKRHTQVYELWASGDPGLATGGANTAHAGFSCAGCHGGATGDLHALPGMPYVWDVQGDVQCVDCHYTSHTTAYVALHMDGTGTDVACVGCHAYGLARDFELATLGTSDAADVFLDPETNQVRPVVNKHGIAVAWYPHNWQTPDIGTGFGDVNSDCAKKCHYAGNPIGATAW